MCSNHIHNDMALMSMVHSKPTRIIHLDLLICVPSHLYTWTGAILACNRGSHCGRHLFT